MTVNVVVHRADMTALGQANGPIGRHWLRLLADIDRRAKQKLSNDVVKVDSGNLRSSQQTPFVTARGGQIVGVAQNVARYAIFVHEGTRPHDITSPSGKLLTGWQYDGADAFTPVVHHPGTKPRPWLAQSVRESVAALSPL